MNIRALAIPDVKIITPRRFADDLLQRLRDLVIVAAVPDAPATGLIDVSEDQADRLIAQAEQTRRYLLLLQSRSTAASR